MLLCLNLNVISTVEDLERNDGTSDRPYFMPQTLLSILKKSNEAAKAAEWRGKKNSASGLHWQFDG